MTPSSQKNVKENRGKLILIVDDEPHMVRMVRMNLEVEGFRVIEARNGIQALDQIRTESQHAISTNANQARSEIQSLAGVNTSSTHTIYVNRVEQNAAGGLVGSGMTAPRGYAKGGSVLSFSRMKSGVVPGTGDGDTVPRGLHAATALADGDRLEIVVAVGGG